MINDLLFVYGTLLSADNEFGRHLQNNATFYGEGKLKGRLYDIGEYPGLITGTTKDYNITGRVYRLSSPEVLKAIDDYEGYGDKQDQPNLYLRQLLPVQTADGVVDCWVYLYNHPLGEMVEIMSGDYQAYIKQKRR